MGETLAEKPAIVKKLFGKYYTGPFSTFGEWHAFEYGAYFGLYLAMMLHNPILAQGMLAAAGIRSFKNLATGELKKQVIRERHYFGGGVVLLFFAGLAVIRLTVGA